jgi:hypothetical protein
MREAFVDRKFQAKAAKVIEQANAIIAEYQEQGFTLTLRQLYYQFVARDLMANTTKSYDYLGWVVNWGRRAGAIDWDAIEDRTRQTIRWRSWEKPDAAIGDAAEAYAENPWRDQADVPIVWIEKAALENVISQACSDWHVSYLACRGYPSLSEMYSSAKIFQEMIIGGQRPVVLYLGDHDPSGIDMTRNAEEQLSEFADATVEVHRIALNMDQVEQYRPPPNPAKQTDKRFANYLAEFGTESWELDAIEPSVIDDLIRREIESLVDMKKWNVAKKREEKNRAVLAKAAANWDRVEQMMKVTV